MGRILENIKAWQIADKFAQEIYKSTQNFPREETYGITSQIRRSAVSVPTNIAEGSGIEANKEYIRFLYIAKGSLVETQYLLHLSLKLGYITDNKYREVDSIRIECIKTLYGLINYLERYKQI